MKAALHVLVVIAIINAQSVFAQHTDHAQAEVSAETPAHKGQIEIEVQNRHAKFQTTKKQTLFAIRQTPTTGENFRSEVPGAIWLEPDLAQIHQSLRNQSEVLLLELPFAHGENIVLELYAQNPYSESYQLKTSDGRTFSAPEQMHYRGIVRNHPGSLAGISISGTEVSGIISTPEDGSWVLGRMENEETLHILFPGDNLPAAPGFECGAMDHVSEMIDQEVQVEGRRALEDCIGLYLEIDYNMYLNRMSSIANVNTWINSVFNNVSILYANEQINIQINDVFVWTSPDGYSTNTSTALDQFGDATPTFDGNLAHLIQLGNGTLAGIAWVDVLCGPSQFRYAVSRVQSGFQNYPTYNWTVQVLTHELGHNIGSPHTHNCSWPGGAIDNCFATEGGCPPGPAPTGGGTIMSYCHLNGGPGINFANGFGPLPGNRIRNRVINGNCLYECGAADPCETLSFTSSTTPTSCAQSNGSISLVISGGANPYTTSIGGPFTGQTVYNNLSSGNYTVTVRDANFCETTANVVVGASSGVNLNLDINSTSCGLNNGSIQVNASGAQAPYQYNIGFGNTSNNFFSNLSTGSYTITVTSSNGCSSTANAVISTSTGITASAAALPTTCGAANGSITVTPFGGGTPYTYDIGNGPGGNSVFNNLSAGTYTVTVTNVNSCTATATATVAGSVAISYTTNIVHTTCNLPNGSISINASNTSGAVQYSLNGNAQAGNVFSGLAAGNYAISVTDAAGCTASGTSVVNASAALNISVQTSNANCGLNQGTITVNVSSGTAPYQYNFGSGNQGNNTVGNLAAGTYIVTVTDAAACTKTAQAVIGSTPALSFTTQTTPAFCGINNGSISVSAAGGNGTYTYSIGGTFGTQSTFSNLAPNTYVVTVQDENGCSSSQNVVVNSITNLTANISVNTAITCPGGNNGALLASISGGSPTYNIVWSGGQNTALITNLSAGTFTVTVTDVLGCSKTASITLTQPNPFVITPTVTPAACFGASSGSINVSVSGATPPYQYSLNGGNFQTSAQFLNLSAGTYSLVVRDASLCTSSASVVVTQNVAVTATAQATNVLCFGQSSGSISITANGGTAPYMYAINGGSFQANNTFSNLPAATYQLTVRDANNCTVMISQVIAQPTAIAATASTQAALCFGQNSGTITVNASGGVGPYLYNLNGGSFQSQNTFSNLAAGTYAIVVQDANNCQFSLGATISQPTAIMVNAQSSPTSCSNTQNGGIILTASGGAGPYLYSINGGTPNSTGVFNGLSAGTYTYLVTGANMCSATGSITVSSPSALNIQVSGNPVTCFGGSNGVINVSATGGSSPYMFAINGGNFGSSGTFNSLPAGTYNLIVQDNNGCQNSNTFVVTQPGAISVSSNVTNVTCFGLSNGAANAQAQGGTGSFQYVWSNGATGPSVSNIAAGSYTLTVTDANGCTASSVLAITQPAALSLIMQSTPLSGVGASDATASAVVSGGSPVYTYQWSSGQNQASIQNLPAGTYQVTVTDANNCTSTGSVIIAPFNCTLSAVAQDIVAASCFGGQNGAATIVPANGQAPYTYAWPGGQSTATVNNLAAGSYSVTVGDANQCQSIVSLTITQPQQLEIAVATTDVSCFGGSTGVINALASGGTSPYTYSINGTDFQATGLFSGLLAGNFTVTIKDANQCSKTFSTTVGSPPALSVQLQADSILCHGSATGQLTSTVSGGVGPYMYLWSNGAQSPNLQGVIAGSYGLSVTDAKGCSISSSAVIHQNDSLYIEIQISQPTAEVLNDGRIEITPKGGTGPYTILWGNQSTESILTDLSPGTYQVVITDANGCVLIQTLVLQDPSCAMNISLLEVEQVSCFGESDGAIEVQVEGTSLNYEIEWSNGMSAPRIAGLSAGTYTVTVEDERGCTAGLSIELTQPDSIDLGIIDGALEAVTSSPETYKSAAMSGMSYNWSCTNCQITPDTLPNQISIIWQEAGEQTISLLVTDEQGCTATTSIVVFVGTNSTTIDLSVYNFRIYPNPASSVVRIELEKTLTVEIPVYLMDLNGRVLRRAELSRMLEWDLSDLPSGMYLIRADQQYFKLIKH